MKLVFHLYLLLLLIFIIPITLNSPANTIVAYIIPIITLAIVNLDTITLVAYH